MPDNAIQPIIFEILGKNVPSSKNSKIKTKWGLMKSKISQEYESFMSKSIIRSVSTMKDEIKRCGYPVEMHVIFVFNDSRRRDLVNILQLPLDVLQSSGVLEDDDYSHLIPVFEDVEIDSSNPGIKFWFTERTNPLTAVNMINSIKSLMKEKSELIDEAKRDSANRSEIKKRISEINKLLKDYKNDM